VRKVWRRRQPHSHNRVYQTKLRNGAVVFDQQHFRHDHQLYQHQHKDNRFAAEFIASKSIGRQRADDELADQYRGDQQECVEEVASERRGIPRITEVLQCHRSEEIKPSFILRWMKRHPHGIEQRQDPEQPQQITPNGFKAPPKREFAWLMR
jgi:hypothetical protein